MALVASTKPLLGNLLKAELWKDHGFCRETLTVNEAAAETYSIGSLVGKVTATGKYKLVDPAAVDGSQVVAGIVIKNVDIAATTDTEIPVLVRGPAVVGEAAIVFDKTFDAGQQATAKAEIEALNILVKPQV